MFEWNEVDFNVEPRFCLNVHDCREQLRRRCGERRDPQFSVVYFYRMLVIILYFFIKEFCVSLILETTFPLDIRRINLNILRLQICMEYIV